MLHVNIWTSVPGSDADACFGWENSLHGTGVVGRHHECKLDARGDEIGCPTFYLPCQGECIEGDATERPGACKITSAQLSGMGADRIKCKLCRVS